MFQNTNTGENFNFLDASFDTEANADNLRWLWVAHILRDKDNRLHRDELPQLANDVFYAA
jgi:hypothetical protein